MPRYILLSYFALISIISIIMTAYDKLAAKKSPDFRISETKLLSIAALGGALAMYLTMQIIRHKTMHAKFMVGLPVLILLHALLLGAFHRYIYSIF